MNTITQKILGAGFTLLLSACVHYPRQYTYYPGYGGYSSGYTIMHRNYYGERPDHYDNGYGPGRAYFPHHQHHDQFNAQPRWSNDHPVHQHDRGNGHPFNYGNRADDHQGWRNHRNR